MAHSFPLEFTLEDGTHVVVTNTAAQTYEFTLKPEDGPARQFTYVDDNRSKTEIEKPLDFIQIDALRRFWLETENIS